MPAQVGVSIFHLHVTPFVEDKFHLIMCPPNTINNLCWCFQCREKPRAVVEGVLKFSRMLEKIWAFLEIFILPRKITKRLNIYIFHFCPQKIGHPENSSCLKVLGVGTV
jgi:hypothetical protein